MIKPIKIAISGLDKTEAMFGKMQKRFAKLGATVDKVKNRFPLLSSAFATAGRGISSALGSIIKGALAMGAVVTAAFTAITISTLNSIDSLGKTSSKIGTTAGALAKLQFAAQQTGVETSTMNMALQRFTRRTAEAAKGTGEAKNAIKRLGLDAKELLKLPLDKRMLLLADAFEQIEDPSEKLALAFKLFDSEGAALVNTLGLGSDALKAMFEDAEMLGLVLSEKAVKGVEESVDAFGRLKTLLTGFSRQAVASFAPAIKVISDQLVDLGLKAADGDVNNIGSVIAKSIVGGLVSVLEAIESMMNAFGEMAHKIQGIYRSFFPTEEMAEDKKALDKLLLSLANIKAADKGFGRVDTTEIEEQILALQEKLSSGDFVPFDFSSTINKLLEVKEAIVAVSDEAVQPLITEITTIGERNWFDKLVGGALDFKDKVGEAFGNIKEQAFDFDSSLNSLVTGSVAAMTQGFTDMITGAKSFKDAIKDMAKSIINSLIKMYVQYMIVQPLFDHMFPDARAGGGQAPPKRALGGPVQGSKPYLVGERGPELFVPNAGGNIIPNNQMGGGGGNVVVNQTINVTTGVQQTVRAEIATLMPQIANAAKGAVAEARQRGGGYSKALVGA
jgi:hypothetical protein